MRYARTGKLKAFEHVARDTGLRLDHPAEWALLRPAGRPVDRQGVCYGAGEAIAELPQDSNRIEAGNRPSLEHERRDAEPGQGTYATNRR